MTTIEIYDPSRTFLEISALDLPISAPYFYLRRSYVVVICTRIGMKAIWTSEVLFSLPVLPQVFRTFFHSLSFIIAVVRGRSICFGPLLLHDRRPRQNFFLFFPDIV